MRADLEVATGLVSWQTEALKKYGVVTHHNWRLNRWDQPQVKHRTIGGSAELHFGIDDPIATSIQTT